MERKRRRIHWGCFAVPYWILVLGLDAAFIPINVLLLLALLSELAVWLFVATWLDKKGWMDPGPPVPPPYA